MGLNHMNGRVQDAITGRFLSADPYIPEPGNTQGYNRYSYVMNNPMSWVDPSGFDGSYGGCTFISMSGKLVCGDSGIIMSAIFAERNPWLSWKAYENLSKRLTDISKTKVPPTVADSAPTDTPQSQCTNGSGSESQGYADYTMVVVNAEIAPFVLGLEAGSIFLHRPGSNLVHQYSYVGVGPGLGVGVGGTLQVGTVGLNSPNDITGFGVQASGFIGLKWGVAGGGFRDVPGVSGPNYYGGTAGLFVGGGASVSALGTYTKHEKSFPISKAPQQVRTALCK
jgi:hypothetical protein